MNSMMRPLPLAITVMAMLVVVKTAGLVGSLGLPSAARANTPEHETKPSAHEPKAPAVPLPAKTPAEVPLTVQEPPAPPPISPAERAALTDLRARRDQLDARASKLDEREALLTASERALGDRLQQLAALQTKLEQLEKERKERDDANWRGLVKTYEVMRPRDAATIFNDLDNAVLVPVLDRMKDAKAAPILAAMNPERARAATLALAKYRSETSVVPPSTAQAAR